MPKSRKRHKPKPPQLPPRKESGLSILDKTARALRSAIRWLWIQMVRLPAHPLSVSVATSVPVAIATWVGVLSAYDLLFVLPEVHTHTAQTDDPFVVPFSLYNPSRLFAMKNVEITCKLKSIDAHNVTVTNSAIINYAIPLLPPRKIWEYQCPVNKVMGDLPPVIRTTIIVSVTYTTIAKPNKFTSEEFNWDNKTRQWSEGEIIN